MQVVNSGRFNGLRPEKLRAVNGEVESGTSEYLRGGVENFGDQRVDGPGPWTKSAAARGLGWTAGAIRHNSVQASFIALHFPQAMSERTAPRRSFGRSVGNRERFRGIAEGFHRPWWRSWDGSRSDRVLIPGCGSGYEVRAFHGWDMTSARSSSPLRRSRMREGFGAAGDRVIHGNFFKHDFAGNRYGLVYERGFLCSLPGAGPIMPLEWQPRFRRGKLAGLFLYGHEPEPPPFP